MNKNELKDKLEKIKAQIKSNSKDAHFADSLISDLISVKGQLDVEPSLVHVSLDSIVDSVEGDTFKMAITNDGKAVYHTYGGYTIVADMRCRGLYEGLLNHVASKEMVEKLTDDEREAYDLDASATGYVLCAPMYAFSDPELKFNLATSLVKWIQETYDKLTKEPLGEETPELNLAHRDAVLAIENLKQVSNQIVDTLDSAYGSENENVSES